MSIEDGGGAKAGGSGGVGGVVAGGGSDEENIGLDGVDDDIRRAVMDGADANSGATSRASLHPKANASASAKSGASVAKATTNEVVSPAGYDAVITTILPYLFQLLTDHDLDTRRCASDSLSNLCARLRSPDVETIIAEAARLAATTVDDDKSGGGGGGGKSPKRKKKAKAAAASVLDAIGAAGSGNGGVAVGNVDPPTSEDLKTISSNLLAEIAALATPAPSASITPLMVSNLILPPILALISDPHFRVRRAAVQSLPRLLAGGTVDDAASYLLPALASLATDDMYRVRKAVGECLVDVSRGIMLLSDGHGNTERDRLLDLRRSQLIPICTQLLEDPNKFVRHGMQQFLGPFIASFYPLGPRDGSDGSDDGGSVGVMRLLEASGAELSPVGAGQQSTLGARFFPHANGMVGQLNPGSAAAEAAEAAAAGEEAERRRLAGAQKLTEEEELLKLLPSFLVMARSDQATLRGIVAHRQSHPPHPQDLEAVRAHLLPAFVALAEHSTGNENLNAEMKVYCAYSLPGVILLMGREGWSNDDEMLLRKCFLSLATGVRTASSSPDVPGDAAAAALTPAPVPLPVKRCLASSFHTICCILGSDIVSAPGEGPIRPGLLQVFEHYFLRDPDDTVRLNVMRTLPSLLSLLDQPGRNKFLPTLHSIIVGDAVLGAPRKRSATNPQLLNWRQRDAVSQILPDLVLLYGPIEVRQYLWPVLQMLLADKVNAVRDDVEFCIPTVLRSYAPENVAAADRSVNAKAFSREACDEVVSYLKKSLLENGGMSSRTNGSYARRQMYCRTCAALAIALRLGKSNESERIKASPTDEVVFADRSRHPYESYTASEYRHMHSLLEDVFLPDALDIREDRVSNVRLTLVDALKVMPEDILEKENVHTILTTLEDEARTWDVGFGAEEYGNEENNVPATRRGRSASNKRSNRLKAEDRKPTTPNRRSKFDKQKAAQDDAKMEKKTRQDGAEKKDDKADEDDANSLSSI